MSEDRARLFVEAHLVDKLPKSAAFARSEGRAQRPSDRVAGPRAWKHPTVQAIVATYAHQIQEQSGVLRKPEPIDANATVEDDKPQPPRKMRRWTRDELLDRLQEVAEDRDIDPRVCVAAIALFARYTALDIPEKSTDAISDLAAIAAAKLRMKRLGE